MFVYTTTSCPKCFATKRKLNNYRFFYKEVTVTDEIADQLRTEGFTQLPVVKTDTDAWEGYRPDKIQALVDDIIRADQAHHAK